MLDVFLVSGLCVWGGRGEEIDGTLERGERRRRKGWFLPVRLYAELGRLHEPLAVAGARLGVYAGDVHRHGRRLGVAR